MQIKRKKITQKNHARHIDAYDELSQYAEVEHEETNQMTTRRVAKFQADMAREVLEAAKSHNDEMVADACRRVRGAWLLGREASVVDLKIVEAFAEE